MGNTTLTIGGTLGDESASVYTGFDSLQFTDAASSLGSWSATLPVERSFSDSLFDEIYIYDDNTILFQGELESLRRFKDDVREVQAGTECGIGVKQYNDVKPGDQIECFERYEVARTLDS